MGNPAGMYMHGAAGMNIVPNPCPVPVGGGAQSPMSSTPEVVLCVPSAVPVNADDDNGSPVTNGIPATRDFSAAGPFTNADPDILQGTVMKYNLPDGGTWT